MAARGYGSPLFRIREERKPFSNRAMARRNPAGQRTLGKCPPPLTFICRASSRMLSPASVFFSAVTTCSSLCFDFFNRALLCGKLYFQVILISNEGFRDVLCTAGSPVTALEQTHRTNQRCSIHNGCIALAIRTRFLVEKMYSDIEDKLRSSSSSRETRNNQRMVHLESGPRDRSLHPKLEPPNP